MGRRVSSFYRPAPCCSTKPTPPRDLFLVRSGFLRASQQEPASLGLPARERVAHVLSRRHRVRHLAAARARVAHRLLGEGRQPLRGDPRARRRALGRARSLPRKPKAALRKAGFQAEALARAENVGIRPEQGSWGPAAAPQRTRANPDLAGTRRSLEAEVLVEEGLIIGREVLVIDQERCTACSNLHRRLRAAPRQQRLQLRGIQVETFMFPTACRHCDDPTCLLCSVDGIVRLPSGEIKIVPENCIGCGSCAERCPYGNISMHPIEKPSQGLLVNLLDFLATGGLRERALEAVDPQSGARRRQVRPVRRILRLRLRHCLPGGCRVPHRSG